MSREVAKGSQVACAQRALLGLLLAGPTDAPRPLVRAASHRSGASVYTTRLALWSLIGSQDVHIATDGSLYT